MVHGGDVLDEHRYQRLVVGLPEVVGHAEGLPACAHAPVAYWRELAGVHHRQGLFARVDVRHHDALRSQVERAVDHFRTVGADTDHGGHAPEVASPGQVRNVAVVDRAVLSLDEHRVEPELAHEVDHVRRVRAAHEHGHDLAVFQFPVGPVVSKFRHIRSPMLWFMLGRVA